MNPYLLEMIAAARREEWRRAAGRPLDHGSRSGRRPIRRAAGAWLIRAGNRVSGHQLSSPMSTCSARPAV